MEAVVMGQCPFKRAWRGAEEGGEGPGAAPVAASSR
jgi:hypothetical protein